RITVRPSTVHPFDRSLLPVRGRRGRRPSDARQTIFPATRSVYPAFVVRACAAGAHWQSDEDEGRDHLQLAAALHRAAAGELRPLYPADELRALPADLRGAEQR